MAKRYTEEQNEQWRASLPKKKVAVKVILKSDKGNILLVKPDYKDTWQMPGGGVDEFEDPKVAAIRETEEETGIKIEANDLRLVDSIFKAKEDYLFLLFESAKLYPEDADYSVDDEEIEEYKFINPSEVASLLPGYYAEAWTGYTARTKAMKLLLTSAGITNDSIANSLLDMVGKDAKDIKVAFIPTAANVEEGDKATWFFKQYEDLRRMGINWIDVIDFAASDIEWQPRLEECDVLFLSGGNTFYLLDQIRKQKFDEYLQKALDTKVYVGSSASSITMTPSIDVAAIPPGDPNLPNLTDLTGLGYIDFEIEPHCDEGRFATIQEYAKEHLKRIYAIDDQTAIKVIDGKLDVISEGKWKICE